MYISHVYNMNTCIYMIVHRILLRKLCSHYFPYVKAYLLFAAKAVVVLSHTCSDHMLI